MAKALTKERSDAQLLGGGVQDSPSPGLQEKALNPTASKLLLTGWLGKFRWVSKPGFVF